MKALERRLALIEAEVVQRHQQTVYTSKPLDVDWFGNPIGSEPTNQSNARRGQAWTGSVFPLPGKALSVPPTKKRSSL